MPSPRNTTINKTMKTPNIDKAIYFNLLLEAFYLTSNPVIIRKAKTILEGNTPDAFEPYIIICNKPHYKHIIYQQLLNNRKLQYPYYYYI